MRLTVEPARLVEKRSDALDAVRLTNAIRDALNVGQSVLMTAQTADATPFVIWSDDVNADSTLVLTVDVAAHASADNAAYGRRYVVRRVGTANPIVISTNTIGADYETDATWDVTLVVAASGSLQLDVTGAAGKTIAWSAMLQATWAPFE